MLAILACGPAAAAALAAVNARRAMQVGVVGAPPVATHRGRQFIPPNGVAPLERTPGIHKN